ncbi:MAG TPA: NACHT domain-containing protein [Oscillatoriaceae cyanobacterium M33_DOE_052]|uniref:NACHT domain-containing protein n=1 Tax=Planktothricoides sp. SpSt-374 TaxID=2282167 RepID=A0A7C3VWH2_9CYAN|nr:NACHT domain-containing protein [Oscillatoriaceae cyanobacterium M33_DOE_052]
MIRQVLWNLINRFPNFYGSWGGADEGGGDRAVKTSRFGDRPRWRQGRSATPISEPEQMFVPLRVTPDSAADLTVRADFLPQAIVQAREATGSLEIWDFLAAIPDEPVFRCLAVIGPSGSGKTTLLENLLLTYAQNHQHQRHSQVTKMIPVLLYVRDFTTPQIGVSLKSASGKAATLGEVIYHSSQRKPNEAPVNHVSASPLFNPQRQRRSGTGGGWGVGTSVDTVLGRAKDLSGLERSMQERQYLVMLDGLDEISHTEARRDIYAWIEQQMYAYPKACFIVTSRSFAYRQAPLKTVKIVLELQPFNRREIEQFVYNWYGGYAGEMPRAHRHASHQVRELLAQIQSSSSVWQMATNPLLLTAIASVFDAKGTIPTNRVELYHALYDVLAPNPEGGSTNPGILAQTALQLMRDKTRLLLSENANQAALPAKFPDLFVARSPGIWEFAHKSFQEYLAAVAIQQSRREQLLLKCLADPWWEETVRFYAAMSDASNVIRTAMAHPATFKLASDCLREGSCFQPELREQFDLVVEAYLESSSPEIFQPAALVLLAERLHRLEKLSGAVVVDTSYITCAEYQLFVDDRLAVGQQRQPDFWPDRRFPMLDSTAPVAGVRASDAEEFCEWLNQQASAMSILGVRFRLPTYQECVAHPLPGGKVGTWSYAGKDKVIAGLDPQILQQWEQRMRMTLNADLMSQRQHHDRTFPQMRHTHLDPTRSFIQHLAKILAKANVEMWESHNQGSGLPQRLVRTWTVASNHQILRHIDRLRDLLIALAYVCDLSHARDLALELARCRKLLSARLPAATKTAPHNAQIDLSRTRADLLLIYVIWDCLARTYHHKAKNSHLPTQPNSSGQTQTIPASTPQPIFAGEKHTNYHDLKRDFDRKKDDILNLYAFLVLLEERRTKRLTPWEGIRIVMERIPD